MIRRSFLASVLIHITVLWLIAAPVGCTPNGTAKEPSKEKGSKYDDRRIEDLKQPLVVTIVDPPAKGTSADQVAYEKFQEEQAKCEASFGGIGVTLDGEPPRLVVVQAHKFYPGERAGIMVGDVIATPIEKMRGEVGTSVRIEVIRDGVSFTLNLVRGKICLRDGFPK